MTWGNQPVRGDLPFGLGKFEGGEQYAEVTLNLPFFGKQTIGFGEKPKPPTWAEKLGNFFKAAAVFALGVLCAAVALFLLPLTVTGIVLVNLGYDLKRNVTNPEQAAQMRAAGTILALPYYAAKSAFQKIGLIERDPLENAVRAFDQIRRQAR